MATTRTTKWSTIVLSAVAATTMQMLLVWFLFSVLRNPSASKGAVATLGVLATVLAVLLILLVGSLVCERLEADEKAAHENRRQLDALREENQDLRKDLKDYSALEGLLYQMDNLQPFVLQQLGLHGDEIDDDSL